MFLYASKLPTTIKWYKKSLRKHVIDVLLSTQQYNIVFSTIPETISKGDVPQSILKYKLRTSLISDSLFDVEYMLIDVDNIRVTKKIKYIDIPKSKLLYSFRLHLYEFILGRKLTNQEEKKFNNQSTKKIRDFSPEQKNTQVIDSIPNNAAKGNVSKKNRASINKRVSTSQPSSPSPIKIISKSQKGKIKKEKTLWDLLKDQDQDISWSKNYNKSKKIKSKKEKENNKEEELSRIIGPPNPFLKSKVNLLKDEGEEIDIRIDMFHFAWRIVDRSQRIDDIVGLTNSFFSILGATFEWVVHNPLNIENLYLRTGFEVDTSLKTEPIKLSDHNLFRFGLGYKLPLNLLPSMYVETNSLVFANLNTAGEGFQDNIVSMFWSTYELAMITDQFYISGQVSKSIGSTTVLEGLNFGEMTGSRIGFNLRYYFKVDFFGIKPWTDFEYRKENFKSKVSSGTRSLEISKDELAIRFGIYF